MWAVEEWIDEVDLVIDGLQGVEAMDLPSVLRRSVDLVIHAISDRSMYRSDVGTQEMAQLLDVSERTIQDWARKGLIPATKVDGRWVADEWALVDTVFANAAPAGTPPK